MYRPDSKYLPSVEVEVQPSGPDSPVVQILLAARKRIELRENWAQGTRNVRVNGSGPTCAGVALGDALREFQHNVEYQGSAHEAFRTAAGFNGWTSNLILWNDDPARTHAEVLDVFDRAIAAERAK